MKIYQSPLEAGRAFPGAVIAIGKFDGIHRGHQKLLKAAMEEARQLKASCLALTFDPAPDQFVRLFAYRPLLTTAQKVDRLREMGIDAVIFLPFTKSLACISPEAFATRVLSEQLKPRAVFVGEDFCFGKDRAGNTQTLKELGPQLGFLVHAVPLLTVDGEKISASRIRSLVERGDRAGAERLLGWRFSELP